MRFSKFSVKQLIFPYLGVIAVWAFLRWSTQDAIWWVAWLNAYPLWLLLPAPFLFGWFLYRRQWWPLGVLGILVGGLIGWKLGPMLLPNTAVSENGRLLTAVTYDIEGVEEAADAALIERLQQTDADIIGLQGVTLRHTGLLEAELGDEYPYRVFARPERQIDVALLSRYPIESIEPFVLPPREMSMHVILAVDERPLHVFVVDMTPNQFDQLNGQSLPLRIRERTNLRRVETTEILLAVQQIDEPIMLLCNCNFTDTSQAHSQLETVLNDAFRQVGWGWGHTANSQRMDYVWASEALTAVSAQLFPASPANHRPIRVELTLPAGQSD